MKKRILFLLAIVLVVVTTTTTNSYSQNSAVADIKLDNLTRADYTITGSITGISKSNRVWILFIPIGGKSATKRHDQAYKQALKTCGCDGIIQPIYTEKRAVIPFILISYSHRTTTVTGKGYRIKTDADKAAETSATATMQTVAVITPPTQQITQQPVMVKGFSVGDKVSFIFKGKTVEGSIVRFNPNNAVVEFTKDSGKVSEIRLDFNEFTKK